MTMTTQQTGGPTPSSIPLGAKLQSARESLRLERKDAAAQLRLNESIIDMIENNTFPATMPPIFVRGYIRAYGKLLQLPEAEIHAGLEPIKPQAVVKSDIPLPTPVSQMEPVRQNKRLVRGFSGVIVFGLLWLSVSWWHTRTPGQSDVIVAAIPTETQATPAAPVTQSIPAGITVQADLAPQAVLPFVASPIIDATTTAIATPKPSAPVPAYKRAIADAGKTVAARNLDAEE